MVDVGAAVFDDIVEVLSNQESPKQTFEIVTDHVTYQESYTLVNGQRVNLGCHAISSYEFSVEETDNLSKWIYSHLGA